MIMYFLTAVLWFIVIVLGAVIFALSTVGIMALFHAKIASYNKLTKKAANVFYAAIFITLIIISMFSFAFNYGNQRIIKKDCNNLCGSFQVEKCYYDTEFSNRITALCNYDIDNQMKVQLQKRNGGFFE